MRLLKSNKIKMKKDENGEYVPYWSNIDTV